MPKGQTSRPANRSQKLIKKMLPGDNSRQLAETSRKNRAEFDKKEAGNIRREMEANALTKAFDKERTRSNTNFQGSLRASKKSGGTVRRIRGK